MSTPVVKQGDWNLVVTVIGVPGSGKTTWIGKQVARLLPRAHVLAHDPKWTMGYRGSWEVYGAGKLPVGRYRNRSEVSQGLMVPGRVHVIDTPDGLDVLRVAREVGRRGLKLGGGAGVPSVCIWDEVTSVKGARGNLDSEIEQFLSQRRHENCGLILGAQMGRNVHYSFFTNATLVVMFRQTGKENLRRLLDAGAPPELVEKLPNLKDYQSLSYTP